MSFQKFLNDFLERALAAGDEGGVRPVHVPVGRTEAAREALSQAQEPNAVVLVYRDLAGRSVVVAGEVTYLGDSSLQVRPPDHPAIAIPLDDVVTWQAYRQSTPGDLFQLVPAWVRAGAFVHPWTPRAHSSLRLLLPMAHVSASLLLPRPSASGRLDYIRKM